MECTHTQPQTYLDEAGRSFVENCCAERISDEIVARDWDLLEALRLGGD